MLAHHGATGNWATRRNRGVAAPSCQRGPASRPRTCTCSRHAVSNVSIARSPRAPRFQKKPRLVWALDLEYALRGMRLDCPAVPQGPAECRIIGGVVDQVTRPKTFFRVFH